MAHREPADEIAARELELYAVNESAIYPIRQSIEKNLGRKWKAGKYDPAKAPKAWSYFVEAAAKRYAKEFASPEEWSTIFSPATRDLVERALAETWEEEAVIQYGPRKSGNPSSLKSRLLR